MLQRHPVEQGDEGHYFTLTKETYFGGSWSYAYLQLVNVHLQEDGARELLGVLSKDWGYDTTRTAPGSSEVNDHLKSKEVHKFRLSL